MESETAYVCKTGDLKYFINLFKKPLDKSAFMHYRYNGGNSVINHKKENTMKIWHVLMNSDLNDGSGHPISTGISFKSEEEALGFVNSEYYADKFGVFGSKGSRRDIEPIEVYESSIDFNTRSSAVKREALREAAISKLTKEEYEALMS